MPRGGADWFKAVEEPRVGGSGTGDWLCVWEVDFSGSFGISLNDEIDV